MSLDDASRVTAEVFSDTYSEARAKFLAAAPQARPYRSSATGPKGEELFTDAAYFGPNDASRLLVLVSATHGVEGYCGSAAQLAFLGCRLHDELPPSTAVLLIHALNCYGFAWDRRVTFEGVDLNRNFVDFSEPVPSNPGHEEIAVHLVPADVSDEGISKAEAALTAYANANGARALQEAIASGQYTVPDSMFYGGRRPTEARRTLEQIASDYGVGSRDEVIIIDYHTGLGPYGYGEPQTEQPSGAGGYDRARRIFGPSVTSPDLGTSSCVAIHGPQDAFWQRLLQERHTYIALEFGTYPTVRNTRKDHWLFKYRHKDVDTELGREIRRRTKAFFYPQFDDWKEMVITRCHVVHRQAMRAFQ